jgi:uncharacterized protein (DUF697 family)
MRQLASIVREISLDELRVAAERVPRIAVIGPTLDDARQLAELVFGPEARAVVVAQAETDRWPQGADVILLDTRARVRWESGRNWVIDVSPADDAERIRQQLVRGGDDIELALGRTFPALRESAANHVILTTSKVNAQFAVASNLPALVPVVGGVLSAGADMLVLTKNQLMMIYKLAAVHGRDIDNRLRIYQEMLPVVGAGLAWRSVARSLAAVMPFSAGAVPKVAIAYAGTFVAGMAAHIYYHEGMRANAERMRELYQHALRELREKPALAKQLPRFNRGLDAPPPSAIIEASYRSDAPSEMP